MKVSSLVLCILSLSACGKGAITPPPPGPGAVAPNAAETRSVQLNAQQFYALTASAYTLPDDYYVKVPDTIQIVGGAFAGNPGQYLHARIAVGPDTCEYQATSVTATEMLIGSCAISVDSYDSGSVVELQAYDAPGLLLEAHVTVSR